ncbi:MAG: hypothetical protein FWD72_05920, partial [Eggerthellaceae bacterium]|nr:hypothetical protein [Eggerthellaceae bacterium]
MDREGGLSIMGLARHREWWGWLFAAIWFFSTYQSYDATLFSEPYSMYMALYCVALGASIIVLGAVFANKVAAISRIARFTTPVTVVLTAVMSLFPGPVFATLFIVSAPFMAPLALRCCYGVVAEAKPGSKLLAFMSGVTIAIFAHASWLLIVKALGLTPFAQFLFPALTCLAAYLITWRTAPASPLPQGAQQRRTRVFAFPRTAPASPLSQGLAPQAQGASDASGASPLPKRVGVPVPFRVT